MSSFQVRIGSMSENEALLCSWKYVLRTMVGCVSGCVCMSGNKALLCLRGKYVCMSGNKALLCLRGKYVCMSGNKALTLFHFLSAVL